MEIFVFIIGFIIYFYLTSASFRGKIGESRVSGILSRLPSSEYSTINNITLQNQNKSTQIDHIVVSVYGIFVIETKNYSGWIMGGEYSDQWVKNVYGNKYYFYNPIKQNYSHISALSGRLSIPKDAFISIVAFPYKADIKVRTSENVVYFREINSTILSYSKKIFSEDEVEIITEKILSLQCTSKEQKKKHISYVEHKKIASKISLDNGICPDCGAPLEIRNGRYGTFLGCSNYPKCKYTHNI